LLEGISQTGEELVVTNCGRPLARVKPVVAAPSMHGSVEYLVPDEELLEPIAGDRDAGRR